MEGDDPRTLGRNMQYISFAKAGKQYLVGNVHGLWNGIDKLDSEDRLGQSRAINGFFQKKAEEYKLLVGDFNLLPETESIRMLEATMRNLIKDYKIQSTRTRLYKHHERFADYVFVTPNLNVNSFEVLTDEVSDHAPLLLDID